MVSGFLVEELSIWDCRDFGFSTRTATPASIASCFARTRCISSFKERPWLSNSSFLLRHSINAQVIKRRKFGTDYMVGNKWKLAHLHWKRKDKYCTILNVALQKCQHETYKAVTIFSFRYCSCHHKTSKESSRELTRYCWQAALLFACKNGIDPRGQ